MDVSLLKRVLIMTVPVIIEQTLLMLMGTVNALMAASLGDTVVSAIGLVDSVYMMILAFLSALGVGVTVMCAQHYGRGSANEITDTTRQGIVMSILLALFIAVVAYLTRGPLLRLLFGSAEAVVIQNANTYLGITLFGAPPLAVVTVVCGSFRGRGNTRIALIITISMSIINIAATYLLLYGVNIDVLFIHIHTPRLGILGAGLGLTIARVVGMVLSFIFFLKASHMRVRELRNVKLTLPVVRSILAIGVPASIESLLFNAGKLIAQTFLATTGTLGLTVNYIANNVFGLLNIPGMAFSIAATSMVGQAYGRAEYKEAKNVLGYITVMSSAAFLVICGAAFPFVRSVVGLYTKSGDVIDGATGLIRITMVMLPLFWSLSFVLPAGFKGSGDVKYTMYVATISMWTIRVGLAYILVMRMDMGVAGVWYAMVGDWILRSAIFGVRYVRGRWIKIKTPVSPVP